MKKKGTIFLEEVGEKRQKNVFDVLAWWLYVEKTYLMKDLNQG